MIALDRNMPKSCECCPCNDDLYRCGVTGIPFGEVDDFDEFEQRMPDCPLIDLTIGDPAEGGGEHREDVC